MSSQKKKVLVLPAPEEIEQIRKRFNDNVELVRGYFKDIEFRFNCDLVILHRDTDIRKYDFIWLSSVFNSRDISHAISVYLDHHGVPHTNINSGEGISKLVDITSFELNKIPIPDTFFQKIQGVHEKVDVIEEFCGFPLIIKDTKGSRGRNIFLVNSKQELIRILKDLPEGKGFIFQQFIPNDYDWGILIADGKVVSAEKSFRPEGEFRNNACWGAREIFEDINKVNKEVKQIAQKACNILNLEWGRADIVVDKYTNKPYLLEVNRFPGMTVGSTEEDAFYNYLKKKLLAEDLS